MKDILRTIWVLGGLLICVSCGSKDPFAGKTWEGTVTFIVSMKTTLEFGTDNIVIVNLGIYENKKGTYSYSKQDGKLVIEMEDHDTLNFLYDASKHILKLEDDGLVVDYKMKK